MAELSKNPLQEHYLGLPCMLGDVVGRIVGEHESGSWGKINGFQVFSVPEFGTPHGTIIKNGRMFLSEITEEGKKILQAYEDEAAKEGKQLYAGRLIAFNNSKKEPDSSGYTQEIKSDEVLVHFIINGKEFSKGYDLMKLVDEETILEDMEICDCKTNESNNHCEGDCMKYENAIVTGYQITNLIPPIESTSQKETEKNWENYYQYTKPLKDIAEYGSEMFDNGYANRDLNSKALFKIAINNGIKEAESRLIPIIQELKSKNRITDKVFTEEDMINCYKDAINNAGDYLRNISDGIMTAEDYVNSKKK